MNEIGEEKLIKESKKSHSTKLLSENNAIKLKERLSDKFLKQFKAISLLKNNNQEKSSHSKSNSSESQHESTLNCVRRETENPIPNYAGIDFRRNSLNHNILLEDHKQESISHLSRNNYFTEALAIINTNDFTNEQIDKERMIDAFKRNSKRRNFEDIKIIISSLLKTKLNEIVKETKKDNLRFTFLVYTMAKEIEYEYIKKGQSVFKIGEKGDKFYIILSGTVQILKLVEEYSYFSIEGYLEYLAKLLSENEIFIVKKTLTANKDILDLESEFIDYALESIFKRRLVGFMRGKQLTLKEIETFFKRHNKNIKESGLDFALYEKLEKEAEEIERDLSKDNVFGFLKSKNDIDKQKNKLHELTEKLNLIISIYMTQLNNFLKNNKNVLKNETDLKLDNPEETKPFLIYKYSFFLTLHQGSYFGDNAIDNNTPRNATVVAVDGDCHLGVFDKEFYNMYIFNEKIKLYSLKIDFVFSSIFNKFLRKAVFEKKYFNFFIYEEYFKDFVLQKQTDKVKYIYFIYEGSLELHCKKNYFELENDIKNLSKHCADNKKEIFINSEISNTLKNFNPNNPANKVIKEELKKTRSLIIKKIGKNEIFGIENFVFNFPSLFSAVVNSKKLIAYRIEAHDLRSILKAEYFNAAEEFFKAFSCKKIATLISRLYEIKKGMIDIAKVKNAKGSSDTGEVSGNKNTALRETNTLQPPVVFRKNSVLMNSNFKYNLNTNEDSNFNGNLNSNKNENSIVIEENFCKSNNRLSGTITLNTLSGFNPFCNLADNSKLNSDAKEMKLNGNANSVNFATKRESLGFRRQNSLSKNDDNNKTNYFSNNNLHLNENNSSAISFYNLKPSKNQRFRALNNNIDTDLLARSSFKYLETLFSSTTKAENKNGPNFNLSNLKNASNYEENNKTITNVINDTEKLLKDIYNLNEARKEANKQDKLENKNFSKEETMANEINTALDARNNSPIKNEILVINQKSRNQLVNERELAFSHPSPTNEKNNIGVKNSAKNKIITSDYYNDFKKSPNKELSPLKISVNKITNNALNTQGQANLKQLIYTETKEKFDLENANENPNEYVHRTPNTEKKSGFGKNKYSSLIINLNNSKAKNDPRNFDRTVNKDNEYNGNLITQKMNSLPQIGKINSVSEHKYIINSISNLESPVKKIIASKFSKTNVNNRLLNLNNFNFNSNISNFDIGCYNELKTKEDLLLNNNISKISRNESPEKLRRFNFFSGQEEEKLNSFNLFNLYNNQIEDCKNTIPNSTKTFYPRNVLSLNNLFSKSTKLQLERKKIVSDKSKKEDSKPSNKLNTINLSTPDIFNFNLVEKFKDTTIFKDIVSNLNYAKNKKPKEPKKYVKLGKHLDEKIKKEDQNSKESSPDARDSSDYVYGIGNSNMVSSKKIMTTLSPLRKSPVVKK